MKFAIHHRKGSFSDHWIEYCKLHALAFKLVNAYDSDIMEQVKGCDVFMWHFHHADYKDMLAAKNILFALEQSGLKVFPNFNTGWHFDNKVAQKYLLESIGAPLISSYVFYCKKSAQQWANATSYPKVFKLKGGAGASNVKLVRSKKESLRLINKSFGQGFRQFDGFAYLKERWAMFKAGHETFKGILKGVLRLFTSTEFSRMYSKEKGYIYFQDFMPNNDGDFRIIVIGHKYAYGMKRMNRRNDFRASGSSVFIYDNIPADILKVAFDVSNKLKLQSVAFDFIRDEGGAPVIIEMSYGFGTKGSSQCPGYWTDDLKWHEENFDPQFWLVKELTEA